MKFYYPTLVIIKDSINIICQSVYPITYCISYHLVVYHITNCISFEILYIIWHLDYHTTSFFIVLVSRIWLIFIPSISVYSNINNMQFRFNSNCTDLNEKKFILYNSFNVFFTNIPIIPRDILGTYICFQKRLMDDWWRVLT